MKQRDSNPQKPKNKIIKKDSVNNSPGSSANYLASKNQSGSTHIDNTSCSVLGKDFIANSHDMDKNTDCVTLLANSAGYRVRFNNYYIAALLIILTIFIISFFINIDMTINLKGQVIPSQSITKIKHAFGGIVKDVRFSNNDKVKIGDRLITLDATKHLAKYKSYKSKLKVVDTDIINAVAYLKNNLKSIKKTTIANEIEDYLKNIPDANSNSIQLTQANRLINAHKERVFLDQINQNKIEITKLIDEQLMIEKQLSFLNEQRKILKVLLKSKNAPKVRALDIEIKHVEVQRELKKIKASIDDKKKQSSELFNKHVFQTQNDIKQKYEELIDLNKQKMDIVSNITDIKNDLDKLTIQAPISGVIHGLNIVKGMTVQPSDVLLSIIPVNSDLIFEAKASMAQKAKINYTSKVEVQFDGFNSLRFNRIPGKVVNISPYNFDKSFMADEFSTVLIKLDKNTISSVNEEYPIQLGISGTLYVTSERQSLFSYLFAPFYNAMTNVHGNNS